MVEVVNVKDHAVVMSSLDINLYSPDDVETGMEGGKMLWLYFHPKKGRYLPKIHGPKQWQLVFPLGLWSSSTAGPHLNAGFPSAHQLDRAHYL